MRSSALFLACSLAVSSSAKSIYEVCQSTKGKTLDPVAGCPIGEFSGWCLRVVLRLVCRDQVCVSERYQGCFQEHPGRCAFAVGAQHMRSFGQLFIVSFSAHKIPLRNGFWSEPASTRRLSTSQGRGRPLFSELRTTSTNVRPLAITYALPNTRWQTFKTWLRCTIRLL